MDMNMINGLASLGRVNGADRINWNPETEAPKGAEGFESIFKSALDMIEQTNSLSNAAEREEMNFALGYTDNVSNLMVAQRKANISLQYTVAVRNAVMSAYREIMNLQF